MPKASFTPPMKAGDSTLMMLLSLNLLLLVFFMMLNSMATYGAKHAQDVLAKVREGYKDTAAGVMHNGVNVPVVPQQAWRAGIASRLQGVVVDRIELRVPPQQGSANKVELELAMDALFDTNGKLARPELVRNIIAAAGVESRIEWQIQGKWEDKARLMPYVTALAAETGHAAMVGGSENGIRVLVSPGFATKSGMGLQVQQVGEDAGATVKGVQESVGP